MSRSRRKPFMSPCGHTSNKLDKRSANRKFRRYNRRNILTGKELYYKVKECSDSWDFDSDGLDMYKPWWMDEESIERIQRK